jgi:hypothetical protein
VIEIDSYKEDDTLLIQPRTIIPLAVNKFSEVGKAAKETCQNHGYHLENPGIWKKE